MSGTRSTRHLSPPHVPVRLPLQVPIADGVALVVELLPLDEGDLRLDLRALEVEGQRHAGHAPGRDGARPALELAAMEQQLAVALGEMVGPGAGRVGRDVRADEKRLSVPERDEGV